MEEDSRTSLYSNSNDRIGYSNDLSGYSNRKYNSNEPKPGSNKVHNIGLVLIGILLGVIITIVILAILYETNSLWFSNCSNGDQKECRRSNYYNDPSKALENGKDVSNALFVADQNNTLVLKYKRFLIDNDCIPGSDQEVIIPFPQQCSLETDGGNTSTYVRSEVPDDRSVHLEYQNRRTGSVVNLKPNCRPFNNSGFTSGTPLAKWNP